MRRTRSLRRGPNIAWRRRPCQWFLGADFARNRQNSQAQEFSGAPKIALGERRHHRHQHRRDKLSVASYHQATTITKHLRLQYEVSEMGDTTSVTHSDCETPDISFGEHHLTD